MSAKPTVVLIGPGGVGKGTVARELVRRDPSLWLSKSWTTRPPRPGESDEYHFTDDEGFDTAVAAGTFLEWAEFHGHRYGTPWPRPAGGQRVLLEIEVQGATQVLAREPDAVVILLEPPSFAAHRARLTTRGDSATHIATRLESAAEELEVGRALAQHVVTNDDLVATVDEVLAILRTGP